MARTAVIDRDRGWKRIGDIVRTQDAHRVAVGLLGKEDGRVDGSSNAEIGTYHEYGAPDAGVPERSFIRSTLDRNEADYTRTAKRLGDLVMVGRMSLDQALGVLGLRVVADIKRTIQRGIDPPLKEATIRRKESSKPLVDTAQMVNALNHEVRRG